MTESFFIAQNVRKIMEPAAEDEEKAVNVIVNKEMSRHDVMLKILKAVDKFY